MAAKRPATGRLFSCYDDENRLFRDNCQRRRVDDDDDDAAAAAAFAYTGNLSGSARTNSFEKVRKWWDLLRKHYDACFAPPEAIEWPDIYKCSRTVMKALQADLLIDAVERGAYPYSAGKFELSQYLLDSFNADDDEGPGAVGPAPPREDDEDDVRFTTPYHANGPDLLASVTRGWQKLIALEAEPQLQGMLMSKEEVEDDLAMVLESMHAYCIRMCRRRDQDGGKQVVLGGGSVTMDLLQQRARRIGLQGPCVQPFIWDLQPSYWTND
jgi:hypothetical protein